MKGKKGRATQLVVAGVTRKATKRLARDFDRAYAAELARRYRTQEPQRIEHEGLVYEDIVSGDRLALELEIFAARGTWETPVVIVENDAGEREFRPREEFHAERTREYLRAMFARLRARGQSVESAIGVIVDVYGVSEQTARDIVYRRPKRATSAYRERRGRRS